MTKVLMPGAILYRENRGNIEEKYVIEKITKITATAADGTRFNRNIVWGDSVERWGAGNTTAYFKSRYLLATPEREQAYQHYKARVMFQNIIQGKPAKEITTSQYERMIAILQEVTNG